MWRLFVEEEGWLCIGNFGPLARLASGDTLANDERVVDLVPVQPDGGDPDDSGYASDGAKTTDHLAEVYYSPKGYWHVCAAIPKLAKASGVSGSRAEERLAKQAIWQIYLPPARYLPRPKFDVAQPNDVHQADLLFLPHDRVGSNT